MITRALFAFSQIVQSLGTRFRSAGGSAKTTWGPDVDLVAESRNASRMDDLPQYLEPGMMTDGEIHRLETLSQAVSNLKGQIKSLSCESRSQTLRFAHIEAELKKEIVEPEDMMVRDFLFDDMSEADELENELFEADFVIPSGRIAKSMIAARCRVGLKGRAVFAIGSSSTGEANPMLYGAYS